MKNTLKLISGVLLLLLTLPFVNAQNTQFNPNQKVSAQSQTRFVENFIEGYIYSITQQLNQADEFIEGASRSFRDTTYSLTETYALQAKAILTGSREAIKEFPSYNAKLYLAEDTFWTTEARNKETQKQRERYAAQNQKNLQRYILQDQRIEALFRDLKRAGFGKTDTAYEILQMLAELTGDPQLKELLDQVNQALKDGDVGKARALLAPFSGSIDDIVRNLAQRGINIDRGMVEQALKSQKAGETSKDSSLSQQQRDRLNQLYQQWIDAGLPADEFPTPTAQNFDQVMNQVRQRIAQAQSGGGTGGGIVAGGGGGTPGGIPGTSGGVPGGGGGVDPSATSTQPGTGTQTGGGSFGGPGSGGPNDPSLGGQPGGLGGDPSLGGGPGTGVGGGGVVMAPPPNFDPNSDTTVFVDENGQPVEVTRDAPWENNTRKGYRVSYQGGSGNELRWEAPYQQSGQPVQTNGQWVFQVNDPVYGQRRTWTFNIGLSGLGDDAGGKRYSATLQTDSNVPGSSVNVNSWMVRDGNGQVIASGNDGKQSIPVVIPAPGTYSFVVEGKTDWGNPFRITRQHVVKF